MWGVCQYNTFMLRDACQNTILVNLLLLIRCLIHYILKADRFRFHDQWVIFNNWLFLYSPRKQWEEIKAFNSWYIEDSVKHWANSFLSPCFQVLLVCLDQIKSLPCWMILVIAWTCSIFSFLLFFFFTNWFSPIYVAFISYSSPSAPNFYLILFILQERNSQLPQQLTCFPAD